jgi:hypothetical protein
MNSSYTCRTRRKEKKLREAIPLVIRWAGSTPRAWAGRRQWLQRRDTRLARRAVAAVVAPRRLGRRARVARRGRPPPLLQRPPPRARRPSSGASPGRADGSKSGASGDAAAGPRPRPRGRGVTVGVTVVVGGSEGVYSRDTGRGNSREGAGASRWVYHPLDRRGGRFLIRGPPRLRLAAHLHVVETPTGRT